MDNNNKNLHDIVDTSEDVYNTKKVKDSSLLLKQKMCKTHDLIKQYTEKVREIDCLKSERNLEVTKKDANYMKSKYKSVIDETKKLEHQIVEDKLKNEKLTDKIKEYEVNIAADKQIIQQLTYKVKELEEKCTAKIKEYGLLKSTLQGKIKNLENELQKSKVTHNRKEKKIIPNNLDTSKLSLQTKFTSDIGVNVSLCDELNTKPEVQEKGIVTDELYNINDHPLLCTNCESQMPLVLTPEKICKVMCTYPELIERNFSPPREIFSSPCLVPSTYPDSTDRHEDVFSRTLSELRMSPCSQDNNSITDNRKSESVFHTMSTTRQNCENNELKNTNITMDKSIATKPLSELRMSSCSQDNDSIADNRKSESVFHTMSTTRQNCENNELKNTNITTDKSIATKPSSNLGPIFGTSVSQQSMNCTREDSYSSHLLAKHSLSIEEIKKQIRLLEGRVKKIKRLKEKPNTNSCHCVMNYNDSTLLNSDLFAIICKGILEHFNNEKKTCSTNVQEAIGLRSNRKINLRKRRLNKYNKEKSASLWKIEDIDERYSRDMLHNNKSENTMNVAVCDILQSKRNVCIDKSNAISYVNASSEFFNDIDDYDKKESFSCDKEIDASSSAEEMSVEGDLTTSHLNIDNPYDSIEKISNNSLNRDNANSVDMDCQEKVQMKISSCNSDCIDDADNKTIDIIPEENKVKRKSQNKTGYGNRLLKKIRNLKRKVQVNSHVNKEESNELYSDHYKPAKKLRIAHIPKTAILQSPNVDQEDFIPCNIKNISNLKTSREKCQRLNAQILKNNFLTENKEDCTISKKCDGKSTVECRETNRIDDKRSAGKIQEDNSVSVNSESCLRNNNFPLSVMDIESASAVLEFDEHDDNLVEDTSKESTSTEEITVEVSRNRDEFEVSDDVPDNVTKKDSSKLEKSIPIKTQVIIQSESSVSCKDSKFDTYKFTENLQVKASDITRKGITPNVELEYICNTSRDESCNNYETPKNMARNDESESNQSINVIEATGHENRNNYDLPNKVSKAEHLQKDSEIIIENYCTDNDSGSVDKSFNKAKNILGKQGEVYANDKITEIQTVEFQRVNVCMNKQDKETKVINPYDNVEQFQTPMSELNKYINTKYIKHKPVKKKKRIHNCTITDRFVKKQLKRLINSDWDNSVHYDVIQKLASTCGPRIIAKCIVEFLLNDVDHDEALDKSFTPPAPLMATFEQKITVLLIDLEVSKPTVFHFVQIAIEYKLFKLNSDVKSQTEWVESLTRMYLALSRIQKDRERVRIMCCNALYCMNLTSINVLYTVFTSWPEVLPNAEINKEILPTCLAFLIGSQHLENKPSPKILKKLIALKALVSTFYKYAYTKQTRDDVAKELMTLLKAKRTNGLDTAIILFAKKQGPSWTYKNIIKSALLPMIINYEHPCIYSAFSLLGKLMRPFENEDNIVQEICEQLCDLIQSGQGTHDQQEGIISALLSLSRQKFGVVAPSIIRWAPNKSLRPTVIAHLQAFISTHDRKFWTSYLQRIESK